jgi:hypothetical protein
VSNHRDIPDLRTLVLPHDNDSCAQVPRQCLAPTFVGCRVGVGSSRGVVGSNAVVAADWRGRVRAYDAASFGVRTRIVDGEAVETSRDERFWATPLG